MDVAEGASCGCCRPASRDLVIETTVLRVAGETCDRCSDTVETVRQAARDLQDALLERNVRVRLIEHAASPDRVDASNTVLINGRPVEEWLGATRVSTDCPSCSELLGRNTCCGAIEHEGSVHESYTVEQIRDAALTALGIAGEGGCC
jgi:hypothetical protein